MPGPVSLAGPAITVAKLVGPPSLAAQHLPTATKHTRARTRAHTATMPSAPGHFSRNCPKGAAATPAGDVGVGARGRNFMDLGTGGSEGAAYAVQAVDWKCVGEC